MLVHYTPVVYSKNSLIPIYTPGQRRGTVRVKSLVQEHNTTKRQWPVLNQEGPLGPDESHAQAIRPQYLS